jgi:hypothetical protein
MLPVVRRRLSAGTTEDRTLGISGNLYTRSTVEPPNWNGAEDFTLMKNDKRMPKDILVRQERAEA